MMATWNPWNQLEALRHDIDHTFARAGFNYRPFFRTAFLPSQTVRRYPLINLSEDRDHVFVEALAPGIDPGALDVAVTGNMLTISGENRYQPEDSKSETFRRSERVTGKFVRTIELPVAVDVDHIKADYKQGLLTVTLPKAAAAKPKQIAVEVA
jgi:HSP20 family protein